jgi:hypothetical protein
LNACQHISLFGRGLRILVRLTNGSDGDDYVDADPICDHSNRGTDVA